MTHTTFLQGLLTAALVSLPLGFLPMHLAAGEPPQPAEAQLPAILKVKALEPQPGDDELRKLLIARYNAAAAEMAARYKEFLAGKSIFEEMVDVGRRLVDSGLELSDKPAEQLALREKFFELALEVEKVQNARFAAGRIGAADLESARYLRLDAEVQVLKAKRKATPPQPKEEG
jgi:hypothetical protein